MKKIIGETKTSLLVCDGYFHRLVPAARPEEVGGYCGTCDCGRK